MMKQLVCFGVMFCSVVNLYGMDICQDEKKSAAALYVTLKDAQGPWSSIAKSKALLVSANGTEAVALFPVDKAVIDSLRQQAAYGKILCLLGLGCVLTCIVMKRYDCAIEPLVNPLTKRALFALEIAGLSLSGSAHFRLNGYRSIRDAGLRSMIHSAEGQVSSTVRRSESTCFYRYEPVKLPEAADKEVLGAQGVSMDALPHNGYFIQVNPQYTINDVLENLK